MKGNIKMIVSLQIGNTDNKLTQQEWAAFVDEINAEVERSKHTLHFFGSPPTTAQWQNTAWIFEPWANTTLDALKERIAKIRAKFRQDSVAFTVGQTEFV